MRYTAVEFDNNVNHTHVKGYIRIPDNFDPTWSLGYRKYLEDTYNATKISIYPLNVSVNSDSMMYNISEFENLEDSFILALRSTQYYPNSPENDAIRRQWAQLDITTSSFTVKER